MVRSCDFGGQPFKTIVFSNVAICNRDVFEGVFCSNCCSHVCGSWVFRDPGRSWKSGEVVNLLYIFNEMGSFARVAQGIRGVQKLEFQLFT